MTLRRKLLLLLVLLAAACGGKKREEPSSSAKSDEARKQAAAGVEGMSALPADSRIVIAVNVAALRDSRLVARAVGQMLARNPEEKARVEALMARCGIDPSRDLDQVLIGIGPGGTRDEVVLVAKGKLPEAQLVECVRASLAEKGGALSQKQIAGRTVHVAEQMGAPDPVLFSFGAEGTVVVAKGEAWLAKAIDPEAPKLKSTPSVVALIERTDSTAPLWGVGLLDPEVGQQLAGVTGGAVKAPVTAAFGHLAVGASGMSFELNLDLKDPADAERLAKFAHEQLGKYTVVAQGWGLGAVVGKLKPEARGAQFRLSLELGPDELRQLEALLDKRK